MVGGFPSELVSQWLERGCLPTPSGSCPSWDTKAVAGMVQALLLPPLWSFVQVTAWLSGCPKLSRASRAQLSICLLGVSHRNHPDSDTNHAALL